MFLGTGSCPQRQLTEASGYCCGCLIQKGWTLRSPWQSLWGTTQAETSQTVEKRTLKKKKRQTEDAGKVGSQTKVFETTDERLYGMHGSKYNHRLAVTNFCPHETLDSEASSHYNPEAQWMDVGTSLLPIPSVLFKRFSNFAYAASKKAKAFRKSIWGLPWWSSG